MPCDAIATTRAQVPLDLASELSEMDGAHVITVCQSVFKRMSLQVTPLQVIRASDLCRFKVGGYTTVTVMRNGRIVVQGYRDDDATLVRRVMEDTLTTIAGVQRQNRIKRAVSSFSKRTVERTAPNGAMILEVEL